MNNPFVSLDSWLIERVFEPIAWRVEYRFNKNNFWLARASIVFVYACYSLFSGVFVKSLVLAAVGFALCTMAFMFVRSIEMQTGKNTANPARHNIQLLSARLIMMVHAGLVLCSSFEMVLVVVSEMAISPEHFYTLLFGILWYVMLFLGFAAIPVYLYFLACSAMPPWWSEVHSRELADRLAMQPA